MQKELAILAMKRGEHCDSEVLDFIFEGLCLVSSDAQWTGQVSPFYITGCEMHAHAHNLEAHGMLMWFV